MTSESTSCPCGSNQRRETTVLTLSRMKLELFDGGERDALYANVAAV